MQLFARDSSGLTSLAGALSLVVANYKPIPQLPTNSTTSSVSNANTTANQMISSGGAVGQQPFITQSADAPDLKSISEWGVPSTLYVPESVTNASSANTFKSTAKIGPGSCPIQQEYTPVGGWSALPAPTFDAFDPVMANIYRYRQQQGVNLGAWFVQEGWMASNFFSCSTGGNQAEYDVLDGFGQSAAGVSNATAYMEKHWDTWITEADFIKMASMGINTVRLPIGYWSAGPYFTQNSPFEAYADVYYYSWRYVARAINWAEKYKIGVLVDLHGAYGSQNGQAHSGLSDGNIEFFSTYNMNLTTNLLVWITGQLANVTNVVGIQLLNEPVDRTSLWPWYTKTMNAMRNVSSTIPLYFHDAFNLDQGAAFVATRTDFVVQDHHSYYVYTSQDTSLSAKGHIKAITGSIKTTLAAESAIARRNVVIGEWSCALAPSSLASSTNKSLDQYNFCADQEVVYRTTEASWIFWSWEMENCASNGGWCFQAAVGKYLPTSFDSWGLAQNTSALFNVTSTKSTRLITALKTSLAAITLPAATNTTAAISTAKVNLVNKDAEVVDPAEVGLVMPSTSLLDLDEIASGSDLDVIVNGGSVATRANKVVQTEKRATATTAFATACGWSDGFKSAQIFASYGTLSRIGFSTQYTQDSWKARLATGKVVNKDGLVYRTNFALAFATAENLITGTITSSS
ncbi:hypothetical protein CBS101457_001620 [Exobasidium rhododendri]|nr:hypothetical protein CBS101457_001620 [Exobasidium rhododendri]